MAEMEWQTKTATFDLLHIKPGQLGRFTNAVCQVPGVAWVTMKQEAEAWEVTVENFTENTPSRYELTVEYTDGENAQQDTIGRIQELVELYSDG